MAKSRDEARKILKYMRTCNIQYVQDDTIDTEGPTNPTVHMALDFIEMALLRKYEDGKMAADLQLQAMKVLYGDKK